MYLKIFLKYLDNSSTVCGWIENFSCSKNKYGIAFISLTDGSYLTSLQVILDPKVR